MNRIIHPNRGTLALLLALICGLCRPSSASIVYVNQNATGTIHDGKDWSTAFTTVLDAANAAKPGDEVWVAAGTYGGGIELTNSASLLGGFAGTETVRSQRNWKANVTSLDGSPLPTGVVLSLNASGSVLDGFAVRNGRPGVSVAGGSATVTNCVFSANYGGVSVGNGTATVTNCTLSGNSGGVSVGKGTGTVANCAISGNAGSGIGVSEGSVFVANCTISGNQGGVYIGAGAATVANCIIARNGLGISRFPASDAPVLSHSDVFGNAFANFSGTFDPTGTNGNISIDPKLSNIYHDVHIEPDSPCIDAGDNSVVLPGWTDIDGQPRIAGANVDMGADESDGTIWKVPSRIWYVSPAGNDASNGTSWKAAKRTVGSAIGAAKGSDEVWVAAGTYAERITLAAGVSLYGGFAGTETARAQRDYRTNLTVLKGDRGIPYAAVTTSVYGADLDGFCVRDGGGGVNLASSITTIANCTIRDNDTGIYMGGVMASIINCSIVGNKHGVGVYTGRASISDCDITGNSSDGVTTGGGTSTIANCNIVDNNTGVFAYGVATMNNCLVSGNSEQGVYVYSNSMISNCTFTANGIGIYTVLGRSTVSNSIVAFNGTGLRRGSLGADLVTSNNDVCANVTANYKYIADPTGRNGNISADPMFVNRLTGDYHLRLRSPCIDTGDDSVATPGETDLDGGPRVKHAHVDMGCYEFPPAVKYVPTRNILGSRG